MTVSGKISLSNPGDFKHQFITVLISSFLLLTGIVSDAFGENPFDGMSAIDIAVAAALEQGTEGQIATVGLCENSVDEATSLNFLRFEFVELRGRPGHEGYFPISGLPVPGETTVQAELLGPWNTANFRLLNEAGELIESFLIEAPVGSTSFMNLYGMLTVPNEPFRVAVSGVDTQATPYDITCSYLYQPGTVEVSFTDKRLESSPGEVQLVAIVTNHGDADTFDLSPSNNMNLPISSSVSQLVLGPGESASVDVLLDIPAVSTGVLNTRAMLGAKGVGNPDSENYGEAVIRLERFDFLTGDGFEGVSDNGGQE